MANAKKCDRCGKFYTKNEYTKAMFNTDVVSGFEYIWSDGSHGETVDLCDNCQCDLDAFMNQYKNVEKSDEKTTM